MRAVRFLLILVLLAAILAGAVYVLRAPLAGWAVRSAMAGAGLERPEARVRALTLEKIVLSDVAAADGGRDAFRLETVEAAFDWKRLLRERRLGAIRVGPGLVRLSVGSDGAVSMAGIERGAGGGPAGLPFSSLRVADLRVEIAGPEGAASGVVNGEIGGDGGAARAAFVMDGFGWNAMRFPAGEANVELNLSADGKIKLAGAFAGDVEARGLQAYAARISVNGEGASWSGALGGGAADAEGAAHISVDASKILFSRDAFGGGKAFAPAQAVLGAPLGEAALAGAVDLSLADGAFELRIANDAPLALSTPDGAAFTLERSGTAPLYARAGGVERAVFRFALASDGINARGSVNAERMEGRLRVAAPISIDEYVSPALALDGSEIDLAALLDGDLLTADVALKSGLKRARIGRLGVSDAPFTSPFTLRANLSAKTAEILNADCITFARARLRLAEQNAEARLGRTDLCNSGGPLATMRWSDDMVFVLNGEVSSRDGRFAMGETSAAGRPPELRFNAIYTPANHSTRIDGAASGGDMVLNDAIALSSVAGRFDFALDEEMMRANARVERLRIEQSGSLKLIAPFVASGAAMLEGDDARFDYVLETATGRALGTGSGVHDMRTASGETQFAFDDLRFAPGGLQPNELALALKGVISAADGGADGVVHFSWSPGGVTSDGEFFLRSISFNGPTLAITRTKGVDGALRFADLLPVKTDGLQTLSLSSVEAGALQLASGDIAFELPGDDTLRLARAEFDWFGGKVGAYDAQASFTGAARIPLRAEQIDLKQILEYAAVNGLSGEGLLSGSLPVVFEDGKARVENGVLRSDGPGAIRYTGPAAALASQAGENAQIAFDFLRDLRFTHLEVTINGALDGQLDFGLQFEGSGDLTVRNRNVKDVPVRYRINVSIEDMGLIRQVNFRRGIQFEIENLLAGGE